MNIFGRLVKIHFQWMVLGLVMLSAGFSEAFAAGIVPIVNAVDGATTSSLSNHGGQVQSGPQVYVVFWGWTSDPVGEQPYLINFLSSVGGSAWLQTVVQYGGGNGATMYVGSWSDATPIPASPTDAQLQAEAQAAMTHFGLSGNTAIQMIVATPTGHSTAGSGTTFCAYHGKLANSASYTVLPYQHDFASCTVNVTGGQLDAVSIVAGHELAESITDPNLNAWYGTGGLDDEIGDKCAWIDLSTITTNAGTFAVQPLWSNATNGCVLTSPASPPAPPNFVRINTTNSCPFMNITWGAVAGATSYAVYVEENGLPWIPGFGAYYNVSAPNTSTLVTENLGGQTYLARVASCNGQGCTLSSATGMGVTPRSCP